MLPLSLALSPPGPDPAHHRRHRPARQPRRYGDRSAPGDIFYTAPGEEHWHGVASGRFMAPLALMEGDDSDAPQTSWGGKVTDADYEALRTSTR